MTFDNGWRTRTAAMVVLGLVCLAACGKKAPEPFGGSVTIELASTPPPPLQPGQPIEPGGATVVTATVYDQSNQGVAWTITPLNVGTLSPQASTKQPSNYQTVASVTYKAPATLAANTTVTITATSISNPTVSASIAIEISPTRVTLQMISPFGFQTQAAYTQTLGPGQQLTLVGLVTPTTTLSPLTWSLSPAGAGSLTNQSGLITYNSPSTVSSPLTAMVTATSVADPAVSASVQITVLPSGAGPNVAAINVNGGPVPTQFYPNAAFTSVTICNPGSSLTLTPTCQNVDGVLVDTGSYGLRILQSQIPALKLTQQVDGNGNTLENCASLVNGSYLWGPVSMADVYMAGEYTFAGSTAGTLIQVISSSNAVVPDGCSNGGTDLNTPQLLGANGILGIGPEPTDCTLAGVNYCDGSTNAPPPNLYYSCPSVGCATTDSPVIVPGGFAAGRQQVMNPVAAFGPNNLSGNFNENNVVLQLPSVSGAESSLVGTLTFVTSFDLNSMTANATVFDLDSNDNFTTIFNGQTLTNSFIDSGSNALYFPDALPTCSVNTKFFCPSSLTNLSAENKGATKGQSTIDFSVDNADKLLSAYPDDAAFSSLAGHQGTYQSCSKGNISCVFNWGLPFFYGRTVYEHIDTCVPTATNPCASTSLAWWAY